MNSYEYEQRLTKDFEGQQEISLYPSAAYGMRRRFVQPTLSDFALNEPAYQACRREHEEKQAANSSAVNTVMIVATVLGIIIGGSVSFSDGIWGAVVGFFAGGFLVSQFSSPKPSVDWVNAKKYDRAVDEYKEAVECRNRIINERVENERRKVEAERRMKVRLERQEAENYWLGLTPFEFEEEVALRLKQSGKVDEARVTKKSGDDGIDIWAKKNGQSLIIQCKAFAAPVGIKEARELLGVKIHENVQRAILVSRSTFASSVYDFAQRNSLELIELKDLVKLAEGRSSSAQPEPPKVSINSRSQKSDPGLKAVSAATSQRCAAIGKSGIQCGLRAFRGSKYCHVHDPAKGKG